MAAKRTGRPGFVPTKEQRAQVTALIACGTRRARVAEYLGIDVKTLAKHFRREMLEAETDANSNVARTLYTKAIGGDTISMIFWLKTRARWKETSTHELVAANGRSLEQPPPSLGISFSAGGPGLKRTEPYDPEKDPNLNLPPGADRLATPAPGDAAVKAPRPALPRPEPVTLTEKEFREIKPAQPAPSPPSSSTSLSTWERLAMSPEQFAKVSTQPPEEDWGAAMAAATRARRIWGGGGQ